MVREWWSHGSDWLSTMTENSRQSASRSDTPRGLSINTLLVLSFVIVSLVPISILGFKVYDAAWENAWREVREKHQSLAKNLAAPLYSYLEDRHIALSLLADKIVSLRATGDQQRISAVLAQGLTRLNRFQAVFLLDSELRIIDSASQYPIDKQQTPRLSLPDSDFLKTTLQAGEIRLSPVVVNPLSGQTTVLIALPMRPDAQGKATQLLVGEIKKEVIETMRAGIQFGEHGHSAIVDPLGQVVAHPNPDWMNNYIKSLARLHIVQSMIGGATGVTEFYSPFKKEDMVAGFTSVPKYGWGIMVPQPKKEVEAQVASVLRAELTWALAGLSIALIVGFSMAGWITRPINLLAKSGRGLQEKNYEYNLPHTRKSAPREIQQLGRAFGGAVQNLIRSREELDTLNQSLQQRVDEATAELREANSKLEELAKIDHLTQLANRRHFEETMAQLASRRHGDSQSVCLLLIDIDRFKGINDQYGHAAGDAVLVQIGEILQQSLRHTDIAARYAGDEFVVMLRADLETGRLRASQLREAIDQHRFIYDGKDLRATVSIGLVSCDINAECSGIESVLRRVDEAMYEAKRLGRNRVAEASLAVAN
jgi:diguanylate cyclase (GGDEF)-like protein